MTSLTNQNDDVNLFLGLIETKTAELNNILHNARAVLFENITKELPKTEIFITDEKLLAKIYVATARIEKFIRKVDKREKGIVYQLVYSTWVIKNELSGSLESISNDFYDKIEMGSFKREPNKRYDPDPGVIVSREIFDCVKKELKFVFEEKKQHRIDINWPYKGRCIIDVK